MKEKLLYLESLRGLAAIAVAFYHAGYFSGQSVLVSNLFVQNSELMVDFFFVLSGFVIAYNYIDRIKDFSSLALFQSRRFLRLYPLHIFTLLVFVAIEFTKYFFENKLGITLNTSAFSRNDWSAFVNNIFLTQAFFEEGLTFNGPSWSISTEFYTYAIFGVLLLLARSTLQRLVLSIVIVLLSGYAIFIYGELAMLRCVYAFFFGVLLYYFYTSVHFLLPVWVVYLAALVVVLAVCFGEYVHHIFHPVFFVLFIASLLLSGSGLLKSILNSKKLVFLGTISYGIYMLHFAVWSVLGQFLKLGLGFEQSLDPITGKYALILGGFEGTVFLLFGTCLVVFLAYLSYRFLEMPFNKMKR